MVTVMRYLHVSRHMKCTVEFGQPGFTLDKNISEIIPNLLLNTIIMSYSIQNAPNYIQTLLLH